MPDSSPILPRWRLELARGKEESPRLRFGLVWGHSYSRRRAGSSCARSVARTATSPASQPTTSTRASVAASDSQGTAAPPASQCGNTATSAATMPTPSPPTSNSEFSIITSRANSARRNPVGAHQRQLAAPLQHAAQLHGRQPERAQQQPQPAQALERRQVRVLHGEERGQPLGAQLGVESIIAQRPFQRLAHRAGRLPVGVDQEKAIAADLRKMREKRLLADQHVALKDAVLAAGPRSAAATGGRSRSSTSNVSPIWPLCRLYSAVLKSSTAGTTGVPSASAGNWLLQQQPGILLLLGRLGGRGRPGKSAPLD